MNYSSNRKRVLQQQASDAMVLAGPKRGTLLTAPSCESIRHSRRVVRLCLSIGCLLMFLAVSCVLIPFSFPQWILAGSLGVICLPVIKGWQSARTVERELERLYSPYHSILSICADQANCGRLAVLREVLPESADLAGSLFFEAGIGIPNCEGRKFARLVHKYLNECFQVANVVPMLGRHVMVAVHPVDSPVWRGKIIAILGEWRSCRSPSPELWSALRRLGEKVVELNEPLAPQTKQDAGPSTDECPTVKLTWLRTPVTKEPMRPAA